MAKAFTLASWNVEHFKGKPARVRHAVDFLRAQSPDVFALYEVEGKTVFGELMGKMPAYTFHITEGPQVQEILVGVKRTLTAFFTQRVHFKGGVSLLRPGALLTLEISGKRYTILFLHTKSGSDPRGMGLRDDMLERACKFRKTLDKAAGGSGKANYLFLGDLNTMGMKYPFRCSIDAELELRKLDRQAAYKSIKMRRLTKTAEATWWGGSHSRFPPSDLDHVVAAKHLRFKSFAGADVRVRGWPEFAEDAARDRWTEKYSDHGLLFLQVER